jgi:hypothetical protein
VCILNYKHKGWLAQEEVISRENGSTVHQQVRCGQFDYFQLTGSSLFRKKYSQAQLTLQGRTTCDNTTVWFITVSALSDRGPGEFTEDQQRLHGNEEGSDRQPDCF